MPPLEAWAGQRFGPYPDFARSGAGRHGNRFRSRARRPGVHQAGGAEDRIVGGRFGVLAGAFPARAADPRRTGASQYRAPSGWRDVVRAALFRDGIRNGPAHHGLLPRAPALPGGAHRAVPAGVRGGGIGARQSGDSPRSEARQYPGNRGRGPEAAGLRDRQTAGPRPGRRHRNYRSHAVDAGLRLPGAGPGKAGQHRAATCILWVSFCTNCFAASAHRWRTLPHPWPWTVRFARWSRRC